MSRIPEEKSTGRRAREVVVAATMLRYLLLSLAAVASVVSSEVISYTSDTFGNAVERHLKDGKIVMVAFYAPWCGHSKKFLPIYDEISEEFEAYNGNRVGEGGNEKRLDDFVFAKVDCVKEMALYSSEGIEHFPTIKVYLSGGEKILYNGERDKNSIVRHVLAMGSSSLIDINAAYNGSVETFQYEYLANETPVAVLFSDDGTDGQSLSAERLLAYEYACKRMSFMACGVVYARPHRGVNSASSSNGNNIITVIRNFSNEESIVYYNRDEKNGTMIYHFFQKNYYPLVAEMKKANEEQIFSDKRLGFHTHCLFIVDTSNPENANILNSSRNVAARDVYFGKLIFAHIDPSATEDTFVQGLLGGLKIDISKGPTVVIVESKKELVNFWYLNELTDINVSSISHFVDDVLFNKAKPSRTSYSKSDL